MTGYNSGVICQCPRTALCSSSAQVFKNRKWWVKHSVSFKNLLFGSVISAKMPKCECVGGHSWNFEFLPLFSQSKNREKQNKSFFFINNFSDRTYYTYLSALSDALLSIAVEPGAMLQWSIYPTAALSPELELEHINTHHSWQKGHPGPDTQCDSVHIGQNRTKKRFWMISYFIMLYHTIWWFYTAIRRSVHTPVSLRITSTVSMQYHIISYTKYHVKPGNMTIWQGNLTSF